MRDINRLLDRTFAQLPSGFGRVADGSGYLGSNIKQYLLEHPAFMPEAVYPHVPDAFLALLAPKVERGIPRKSPDLHPTLFGADRIYELMNLLLSKRQDVRRPLQLNLGIGTDGAPVSPCLPAYIELGLQRLEDLLKIGVDARLRVFNTGSLAVRINGLPSAHVSEIQNRQLTLITAYVKHFHGNIAEKVDLKDITIDLPPLKEDQIQVGLDRIRQNVPPPVLGILHEFGRRHAPLEEQDKSLLYALYHGLPSTFRDNTENAPSDPIPISVGGPGEYAFNVVRWGLSGSSLKAGIVSNGLGARTAPYLWRPVLNGASDVTWDDIGTDPSRLLKGNGATIADFTHIARCVGGATHLEGLERYLSFCRSFNF